MKLSRIIELTGARILCGQEQVDCEVSRAFSSDLMSDVLTLGEQDILLITGLVNNQVIRTAEVADIRHILIVRNKPVSDDMVRLARENNMCLIASPYSMFRVSGALYQSGLHPVY